MNRRVGAVLALLVPFLIVALISFSLYQIGNPLFVKFVSALGEVLVAGGAFGAVVQYLIESPPTRYQSLNLERYMKPTLLIAATGAVLIASASGVELAVYSQELFGTTEAG